MVIIEGNDYPFDSLVFFRDALPDVADVSQDLAHHDIRSPKEICLLGEMLPQE